MPFALMLEFEEPNWGFKYRETNIYEILYSPESNFFLSMYGDKRVQEYEWVSARLCDIMKRDCVSSSDPLQYLIDNLKETTII